MPRGKPRLTSKYRPRVRQILLLLPHFCSGWLLCVGVAVARVIFFVPGYLDIVPKFELFTGPQAQPVVDEFFAMINDQLMPLG